MARTRGEASDPIQKLLSDICLKDRQIPQEFHRIIVQKAQEKIRVLNAKVPHKVSANDTPDSRNAVVLEFILRKGITLRTGKIYQEQVPFADFGREIGRSEKYLDSLSASLRSHLEQCSVPKGANYQATSSTATAIKRRGIASGNASKRIQKLLKLDGKDGKGDDREPPSKRKYTGKPSTPIRKHIEAAKAARKSSKNPQLKSIITIEHQITPEMTQSKNSIRPLRMHELSMKLQNKLHDPNACEKAATVLFLRLIKCMVNDPELKTLARKKSAIHEIEQNLKIYEGCCFFIAAKQIEKGEDVDLADLKNTKKRKIIQTEQNIHEEEENNGITVEEIALQLEEIPSQLSNFLVEIIPKVKEMNMSRKKDFKLGKQDDMASSNVSTSRSEGRSTDASLSRQEYIDIINSIERHDAEILFHDQETILDDANNISRVVKPIPPYNYLPRYRNLDAYNSWREKCLQSFMAASAGNTDKAMEMQVIEIFNHL